MTTSIIILIVTIVTMDALSIRSVHPTWEAMWKNMKHVSVLAQTLFSYIPQAVVFYLLSLWSPLAVVSILFALVGLRLVLGLGWRELESQEGGKEEFTSLFREMVS